MPVTPEFTEKVHKAFLDILLGLMSAASINLEYSRTATQDFLRLFPAQTVEELNKKIKSYAASHQEFKQIHIEFMKLQETDQTSEVLNKMRTLMKDNHNYAV